MGKAGDVLDDVFFVVKGKVEARVSKPGKQVRSESVGFHEFIHSFMKVSILSKKAPA